MHSDYQMLVIGTFPMKSSAQWDMNLNWLAYTRGSDRAPVMRAAISTNSSICTDAVSWCAFSLYYCLSTEHHCLQATTELCSSTNHRRLACCTGSIFSWGESRGGGDHSSKKTTEGFGKPLLILTPGDFFLYSSRLPEQWTAQHAAALVISPSKGSKEWSQYGKKSQFWSHLGRRSGLWDCMMLIMATQARRIRNGAPTPTSACHPATESPKTSDGNKRKQIIR